MKRKIIKQGHNTLTMTIPSEWAKKLNIGPGDEIDLVETDNTLILNGHMNSKSKQAVIEIKDFTIPLLWRYFQSAYRAGCDEIKIIYDSGKKQYEDPYHYYTTQFDYAKLGEKVPLKPANAIIQEVVNRFIGVDILESGEGYCVVKEMGEVSPKEFDNSLRRIFLVILQMFDRIKEAVIKDQTDDASLCKEVHATDIHVDKLVDYCARILNKTATMSETQKQLVFASLFLLELVGDEFKYIGKHLATSKHPVKEILPMLDLVKNHFETYYSLYYKFDRDKTIEFGEKDVDVYEANFRLKEKAVNEESRSILKHLMLISKYVLSLTELRIQMEF